MDNNRSFNCLCGGDPRIKIDSGHNRYWRLYTYPISPDSEVIKDWMLSWNSAISPQLSDTV